MKKNIENPMPFVAAQAIAACVAGHFANVGGFWGNLALYLLVLVLPSAAIIRFVLHRPVMTYLSLDNNLLPSIAKGMAMGGFVAAVFFIVNGFSVQGVNGRAEAGVLPGLVLAAIFEEIAFRGLFLSVFATRWGFVRANLLQSALFAGIHLQSINPTQVWRAVFLFVLALWLGYFRKKTGSLWPPILLHAAYNLAIALLL